MRNVSDPSCGENQNTRFMFNTFFPNLFRLYDNVEKYIRAGQATDNNTAHAHYMLDNSGYMHTLRICNIYSFSTATTKVTRTCLLNTLYINCLPCFSVVFPLCSRTVRLTQYELNVFNMGGSGLD